MLIPKWKCLVGAGRIGYWDRSNLSTINLCTMKQTAWRTWMSCSYGYDHDSKISCHRSENFELCITENLMYWAWVTPTLNTIHKSTKILLTQKTDCQNGQTQNITSIYSYCVLDWPIFELSQILLHPELTLWVFSSMLMAPATRNFTGRPHPMKSLQYTVKSLI